jgi:hypothetical protein
MKSFDVNCLEGILGILMLQEYREGIADKLHKGFLIDDVLTIITKGLM